MAKEIVFIAGKDPCAETGGHSSFLRSTARAALKLGFTPHIFCSARHAGKVMTDFGVVHRTASPFRSFRQTMLPFHAPMVTAELKRFLSGREGPHLIHGLSMWGGVGVSVARELRRRGHRVATVVSAYTTMEHEAYGKLLGLSSIHGRGRRLRHWGEYAWFKLIEPYERRAYLQSDLVVVNYESVRRLLVEKYGEGLNVHKSTYAPETAFLRVTEAVPSRPPEPLSALRPREAPLITLVSRHDPRKGVDVLLRALAELRKTDVQFRACLVSGGPLFAVHQRLAKQLGLGDSTVLTGWVPDPTPYLQHADIFVLPSLEEGSGAISMLEAMQVGVAVVASNVDGVPEDVVDGDSALLVEPGSVDQLSRALARLLSDVELRTRLARRARITFAEKFSAEAYSSALREVYARLGFECAPGNHLAGAWMENLSESV
jgi:glycosyltransferase involved in cell wall biosynthesis